MLAEVLAHELNLHQSNLVEEIEVVVVILVESQFEKLTGDIHVYSLEFSRLETAALITVK